MKKGLAVEMCIRDRDMQGESWCSVDLTGAAALVVGSEGRGISRLVSEQCDFRLSLPRCV